MHRLKKRLLITRFTDEELQLKKRSFKWGIFWDFILILIALILIISIEFIIFGIVFILVGITDMAFNIIKLFRSKKAKLRL